EAVLITQANTGFQTLAKHKFPIEIHRKPNFQSIPDIYASCDVYLCTSWHEGFGLPALEAFAVGIPVVSTDNDGVHDYGVDGHNLLIAKANDPQAIADRLKVLLSDESLQSKLIAEGFQTQSQYDWKNALTALKAAQDELKEQPKRP